MGGPAIINNVPYKEFDNFFICNFYYGGYLWTSSEQAYQALKFLDPTKEDHKSNINYNHFIEILNTNDPYRCWQLGRSKDYKIRDEFEENKADVMYNVCLEKVQQNWKLSQSLMTTRGNIQFLQSSNYWNRKNAEIYKRIRGVLIDRVNDVIKFHSSK